MAKNPFFSVVIPTYNRERFVKKAVLSVLGQTFSDLELIVVDDGSIDNTENMIRALSDKRLKYLKQDNKGVSRARNRGLELSTGKFVAFLDSDDIWVPKKLERTAEYIHAFPRINIFHSDELWIQRNQILPQKTKHSKPTGKVYLNALAICCISISTAVVKKTVFDRIGIFDECFEACEDYDLWLRASNIFEVKLIPETLTIKHGGRPDQLSSSVWGLDRFRIKALEKMLRSPDLTEQYRQATSDMLARKCELFASGCEKRAKTKEAEYYRKLPLLYKRSSPDVES